MVAREAEIGIGIAGDFLDEQLGLIPQSAKYLKNRPLVKSVSVSPSGGAAHFIIQPLALGTEHVGLTGGEIEAGVVPGLIRINLKGQRGASVSLRFTEEERQSPPERCQTPEVGPDTAMRNR